MTIISARSLSASDIRHLGANLAAVVQRDRHDIHTAAPSRPVEAVTFEDGHSPVKSNKKEPMRC